ncbi:large extracellular alpha-helical protein [Candidatus Scalindua japonica]|uniref:Large extracellular alpha-helical protein n=1 Tax=Candidatus Scalindua japonica TaxID=1284222 RepID=A0A286U3E7_9BACT|nr:hypothetical protein [Candidatus Scalindua japonica]GAX62668.1 large extracellular alpha-helical protein [Candidatus Scalindua japonica]
MKIVSITITLLLLLIANNAFAECWIASGFKGYGSNAYDKFNIHEDGLSNKKIHISINGNKSSVTGSEEISFKEVTPQLIVGVYMSGSYKGVVESWGIDIENRKVFYTQTKSGYTIFDGAKMFIGDLEGKCK